MKMWIAFLIPKIEDGNNFGVSVQVNCTEKEYGVLNEREIWLSFVNVKIEWDNSNIMASCENFYQGGWGVSKLIKLSGLPKTPTNDNNI